MCISIYYTSSVLLFYRSAVYDAVLRICKDAMKKATHNCDWLYVLPLCHFLSGSCKPYDNVEYYPTKYQFHARAVTYGYKEVQPNILPGYVSDLCVLNFVCSNDIPLV